jgi:TPR repeat protein
MKELSFDLDESLKTRRSALEDEDPKAMYEYGLELLYGRGVPRDPEAALALLAKSGQKNNLEALLFLGDLYYKGEDIPADYDSGAKFLAMAAELGSIEAMKKIRKYFYGKVVKNSYPKPEQWAEVFKWTSKLVESGFTKATDCLAEMYYYGQGTDINYELAFNLFTKASCYSVRAKFFRAVMFESGLGVEKNNAKALDIYKELSKKGYPPASLRYTELAGSHRRRRNLKKKTLRRQQKLINPPKPKWRPILPQKKSKTEEPDADCQKPTE